MTTPPGTPQSAPGQPARPPNPPPSTIVVNVMPRPELSDPQGQAIGRALADLGLPEVTGVRAGKRFLLEVAGPASPELAERVARAAAELLANPVIEDYSVHFAEPAPGPDQAARGAR